MTYQRWSLYLLPLWARDQLCMYPIFLSSFHDNIHSKTWCVNITCTTQFCLSNNLNLFNSAMSSGLHLLISSILILLSPCLIFFFLITTHFQSLILKKIDHFCIFFIISSTFHLSKNQLCIDNKFKPCSQAQNIKQKEMNLLSFST